MNAQPHATSWRLFEVATENCELFPGNRNRWRRPEAFEKHISLLRNAHLSFPGNDAHLSWPCFYCFM